MAIDTGISNPSPSVANQSASSHTSADKTDCNDIADELQVEQSFQDL